MGLFLGMIAAAIAVAQILALVYAQQAAKSGGDAERIHRDAAINGTIVLLMGGLLMAPFPWYKKPPIKGIYTSIATNLKPRDKKGKGWLEPQKYANKKEEKAALWMYATVHKTLVAALVATLAGILGGALSKVFSKHLQGSSGPPLPSGPRSPYSGRSY
jgi:hypothetical protein